MNTNSNKGSRWGFSNPSTLVNVGVVALAMLGSGSFGPSSMRKVATMASYPVLNHRDQNASSLIAQDIRQASSVDSASAQTVVLNTSVAGRKSRVTYVYDSKAGTVIRMEGQNTQTILKGVDSFSFSLFQRPTADAAYGKFVPAVADNARLVGCRWSCSRTIAGAKCDSESMEIAPTLLRNHC
jgi:hypothetical protein